MLPLEGRSRLIIVSELTGIIQCDTERQKKRKGPSESRDMVRSEARAVHVNEVGMCLFVVPQLTRTGTSRKIPRAGESG